MKKSTIFTKYTSALFLTSILLSACMAGTSAEASDKDIVILYTNDVHCGIEDHIGYAGLAAYVNEKKEDTPYVTLVDCGDAVQGDFIGTISKGDYLVDLMNEVGYDYAILGNHEFDYGMPQLTHLIEKSNAVYLGCNLTYSGTQDNALSQVQPYDIVNYGATSVAFIGVSTPYSITSSTPSYFMEGDEYVYGFSGGENGQLLYDCVQSTVDLCKEEGADYVVLLTHLGDDESNSPYSSTELIQNTKDVDVCLDAHAHNEIASRIEQNLDGEDVLLSSTGTKLENIGQLVITANDTITTTLISSYDKKDEHMVSYINEIKALYEAEMNRVVASSDIAVTGYSENEIRLVRTRETTIGNLCADAYRSVTNADIAIVNGGGIRADLPKGDITYADVLAVHPYGNMACVTEASGQEIWDCLEMASRAVLAVTEDENGAAGENGGFLQVSGLTYTIDTSIESSVVTDENNMFVSIDGPRRVKNVKVLDENGVYQDLDPEKTYTLASHNYLIKEGGDGINMFCDNPLLMDEGMVDSQVLITYLTEFVHGQLGDLYSSTEGRIIVE